MNVVIIEDEQLTADDLAACIIKAEPSARIVAMLSTVKDAIAYFKENDDPDLIFSDIQLGDGLSFKIFDSGEVKTPVIFCTAYDEYALEAFHASGIDYILKPFTAKSIAGALAKYEGLRERLVKTARSYENLETLFGNARKQSSVLVFQKEKILPVKLEEIALFYLQNENTHLVTFSKQHYFVSKNLEELEKIAGDPFYRVNRQFLVNRGAIKDVSQYFGRKLLINLDIPFEEKITVGKVKANHFLAWLAGS